MKVKPNLFLNMSPQTTEEGGLAFARNMKLDDDGNLISDYGYKNISSMASYNIVGHIVGLDNKIYFFCYTNNVSKIVEYDEITETATPLNTAWTYDGGEIDGYVNTNQSGEKILTVGEYKENGNIPLKHINLSFANVADESIYCQAPRVPTANLILKDTYAKAIPNGTYVFFIRYKIRKDVYTNWYLCSCPIFAGTSDKLTTLQGGVKYINIHRDSAKSFIFRINFPVATNKSAYSEFQLGFIITHDEATDARIWKSFNISNFVNNPSDNQNLIYFDYENITETNIDDLLETTYELYNVRNVTSFKNKLYISNYKETNFNPVSDLQTLASKITIGSSHTSNSTDSDVSYKTIKLDNHTLGYNYALGYYDSIEGYSSIKAYIANNNIFDYAFTNFGRGDLIDVDDIAHFDLTYSSDNDPDILLVSNIVNNTYNKVLFGPNYNPTVIHGRAGIYEVGHWGSENPGQLWLFDIDSNNPHPWYSLGFTLGYTSVNENDVSSFPECRNHCLPMNMYTKRYGYDVYTNCWVVRDVGFNDYAYSFVRQNIESEIKTKNEFIYGYCYVASGGNRYNIDLSDQPNFNDKNYVGDGINRYPFEASGNIDYAGIKTGIKTKIYNALKQNIVGIDEAGVPVLALTNADTNVVENVRAANISVVFKSCEFKVDTPEDIGTNDDGNYNKRFLITLKAYDYTTVCTVSINNSHIVSKDNVENLNQASSLMPYSSYDVYLHFVDEHNIITNGIKKLNLNTGGTYNNVDKLILNYSIANDIQPGKYKAFFASIVNVGDLVMETFNYRKYSENGSVKLHIVECLEVDAMLYNINDNITVVGYNGNTRQQITTTAKYYTSGHSVPSIAFGNCGFIAWEDNLSSDWSNYKIYIIISRSSSDEEKTVLIKATPYIPLSSVGTTNINNGFYGSYFCLVRKPSFDLSKSCYAVGNDVYSINRDKGLVLSDFDYYIQQQDSPTYFVRSNFNLNYLSTTEDITDKISNVGKASSGIKQVAKVLNSATLSFIYELKSMYKDFMNKTFSKYDTDYKIDFDNTVRVSHVLSDETFNNSIFKFTATDYYNVPTDRGIIVNLFSIGNNIFVHTKDSFYKFDGNQTITSSDQDIQLQESEPFETGISQIFDSEYGYGGITTKQSGCITFDSYFFYDKASNHIFAYGGNSQVQLIDGNIYKILAYYKPKECKTLHDELNCRVLFEFTSGRSEHSSTTYKTFTLSYNYKSKTFVSFHDLSLVDAFAGRHRAYSYKSSLLRLFEYETTINTTSLVSGMNVNQIFGNATTACIIEFGSQIYKKQATPFGIAIVLFPQNNIKEVVNSVKYIADIQQKDPETQSNPVYDVLINPQVTRTNPVVNFFIVTDSCVSSLVNTNVNDNARPNTLLDYKGFKYDMGFWTSNFFRNDINKTNIYDYPQEYPNRALDADNNSLVYGRYFIFIFDFKADTPIKFEELFMNTDKY